MNFHNRIRLGDGKHEHPHRGEEKGCDREEETALSHVALVEFCGGAGKKQNGGEQHGIAKILRRNITCSFCLGVVSPGVSVGLPSLLNETRFIKLRHKRMRVRIWIL